MNPIRSYFEWHDAKYLARTVDARKNHFDIRWLLISRVVLFIASSLCGVCLVGSLLAMRLGSEGSGYAVLALMVLFGFCVLMYTWVTEALLFCRYIEEHRHQTELK